MNKYIKTINVSIEKDTDNEHYILTEYNQHEVGFKTQIIIYFTHEKEEIKKDYADLYYLDRDSFLDYTGDFDFPAEYEIEQYNKDCRDAKELDQAEL